MNDYEALLNTRRHCKAPDEQIKELLSASHTHAHVSKQMHISGLIIIIY